MVIIVSSIVKTKNKENSYIIEIDGAEKREIKQTLENLHEIEKTLKKN